MPVPIRFLTWHAETTLALAVIGAAVIGGLLVFVSSFIGQQRLRARLREAQARLRDLEARPQESATPPDEKPQ